MKSRGGRSLEPVEVDIHLPALLDRLGDLILQSCNPKTGCISNRSLNVSIIILLFQQPSLGNSCFQIQILDYCYGGEEPSRNRVVIQARQATLKMDKLRQNWAVIKRFSIQRFQGQGLSRGFLQRVFIVVIMAGATWRAWWESSSNICSTTGARYHSAIMLSSRYIYFTVLRSYIFQHLLTREIQRFPTTLFS